MHWGFNAWSGLYSPWEHDASVGQKTLEIERIDRYRAPLILEGGSIHVDGEGTLLTTEECLLNPNRNPGLSQNEIERYLREYLGVVKVVWLGKGVYCDETSGHIDNLCCFIRPGVVALTWTDDKSDPQYAISLDAYDRLVSATDARGRKLEIHRIQQPGPLHITEAESQGVDEIEGTFPRKKGNRLPASYVNCYVANKGVIVPMFGDPQDSCALSAFGRLFPERQVFGVSSREILLGGGSIHCVVQQQPSGMTR